MDDELKVFKSIKLANKSNPLQDVIQQLVEHVVPVATKQYVLFLYSAYVNFIENSQNRKNLHSVSKNLYLKKADFSVSV